MAWFVYVCHHRKYVGPPRSNKNTHVDRLCASCQEQFETPKHPLASLMEDRPDMDDHVLGMKELRARGGTGRRKGLKIPRE